MILLDQNMSNPNDTYIHACACFWKVAHVAGTKLPRLLTKKFVVNNSEFVVTTA